MIRARLVVHPFPVPPAIFRVVAFLAVTGLTTALAAWPAQSGPDRIAADQTVLDTAPGTMSGDTETDMKKTPGEDRNGEVMRVDGGRVTLIDIGAEAGDRIRVTDPPEHGHLSVNPDGRLALVLSGSDHRGALDFTVEITRGNGAVEMVRQALSVTPSEQALGWGAGEHYTLRTDADGDSIIEHGAVHREVYASGSEAALSLAEIAALEGVRAKQIDGAWLADHPEYGTAARPLDAEAAGMLWAELTGDGPSSHHLLLERGYEYDMPRLIRRGVSGESELTPLYVGAWGDGAQPVIASAQKIFQSPSANIVFDDLEFVEGITVLGGRNMLFEDVTIREDGLNVQKVENFTLRDSLIVDVVDDSPNGRTWSPHKDRESGIFAKKTDGLLLEGNFFHHNGWQEGYRPDGRNLEAQNPTKYSHNVYVQRDASDVTFRDNVTAQGASFGAQIRPGGHVVDNLFLDNNAGLNVLGGQDRNKDGIRDGNFSLLLGNVVTSAGHLETDKGQGALARGIDNAGAATTLADNIVAHLANPADAKEQAQKTANNGALRNSFEPETDDTIVYNWVSSGNVYRSGRLYNQSDANQNLTSDAGNPDKVTIQTYTAELLGEDRNTIRDLTDYLRTLYVDGHSTGEVSAAEIAEWFLAGFGRDTAPAPGDAVARFVPQEDSDGIRWDNRLNWAGEQMPGSAADLAGNHVVYAGTATLDRVDLGPDGGLLVSQGYLALREGFAGTGQVRLDGAGQVWTTGGSGTPDYLLEGGRLVFDGRVAPEALAVDARDGQVVLTGGTHMTLGAGDTFVLRGRDAQAGFDGNGGAARLEMTDGATLAFAAEGGTFGRLGEFQSGAFGDTPEVNSTLILDGTLRVDVSDLNPRGGRAVETVLLQADEITGQFDRVEIAGLDRQQSAALVLDYEADTLILQVRGGGRGVDFDTAGADGPEPEIRLVDPLPDFGSGWLDGA